MTGGTRRWDTVLFDLDGTLADTVELILRCYRHTMNAHLGRILPDEEWLETIGTPLRDQLRDFAASEAEAEAMLETYTRFQRKIHDEAVRPFPGVHEVLDRLGERGVPLGVVTSKRREMALRTLEACRFDGDIRVLVAADDVERGKPDPEPVRAALGELGVVASRRVLFVGDSPYDVRAGRGAGIATAGVLWGPFARERLVEAGADYILEEPGEVLGLQPEG